MLWRESEVKFIQLNFSWKMKEQGGTEWRESGERETHTHAHKGKERERLIDWLTFSTWDLGSDIFFHSGKRPDLSRESLLKVDTEVKTKLPLLLPVLSRDPSSMEGEPLDWGHCSNQNRKVNFTSDFPWRNISNFAWTQTFLKDSIICFCWSRKTPPRYSSLWKLVCTWRLWWETTVEVLQKDL